MTSAERLAVKNPPALGAVLVIVGAAFIAVTNHSFWIDECITANFASAPTLASFWGRLKRLHFPEIQVPLYMLYVWGWEKLFGTGEWVLRVAGLPWFVGGATIFSVCLGRVVGSALLPALIVAWSAFAWYYLNEARLYSTQLGIALAFIGSATEVIRTGIKAAPSRKWSRLFLLSLFLLCASSVLGALWGFFFFAAFLLLTPRSLWSALWRIVPWSGAVCGLGLALLAGYYAWTMTMQIKATAVGTTTPQTIVFLFYELLGAAGLGPGRNDLRDAGASALRQFALPLMVFTPMLALVLWRGFEELCSRYTLRSVALVSIAIATPFCLLCIIGVLTHFRLLGRHVTPLLALFFVVMIFGIIRLTNSRGYLGKLIAASFLILNLYSCLSVRFAVRHEKDDYKGAAIFAKAAVAAGESVWWNAEPSGADYYKVRGANPAAVEVVIITNPLAESLRALPEPGVAVVSKPDVYDHFGGVAAYLHEHDYEVVARLTSFVIWVKRR